ncbi:MAG: hypothetical protein JOY92_12350 [Verrucomicrobia bacterium]|nr:hypothetical protein [Verrucomicrobiota bacterium]
MLRPSRDVYESQFIRSHRGLLSAGSLRSGSCDRLIEKKGDKEVYLDTLTGKKWKVTVERED